MTALRMILVDVDVQSGELGLVLESLRGLLGRPVGGNGTAAQVVDRPPASVMAPASVERIAIPTGKPAPAVKRSASGVKRSGPRSTVSAEHLAEAKRLWIEGQMAATDISKKFGKSDSWVGVLARTHGWPPRRPKGSTQAKATPKRRCQECEQLTMTDPCDKCGEAA